MTKDAAATPEGEEKKEQWAGKGKKRESERPGCNEVVSSLQPQLSAHYSHKFHNTALA